MAPVAIAVPPPYTHTQSRLLDNMITFQTACVMEQMRCLLNTGPVCVLDYSCMHSHISYGTAALDQASRPTELYHLWSCPILARQQNRWSIRHTPSLSVRESPLLWTTNYHYPE